MPLEVSSTRGFNEQQIQDYWEANTALQIIFESQPPAQDPHMRDANRLAKERRRAAASLVRMGLGKSDFQQMLISFRCMDYNEKRNMLLLKNMGLSMEQIVHWLRAPEKSPIENQVATREVLFSTWERGLERGRSINKAGLSGKVNHGTGALIVVGCAVAAVSFLGAGYGLSDPALTQTGKIMYGAIPDKWDPLASVNLRGLGGRLTTLGSLIFGSMAVHSWVGRKNKAIVDARRTNLSDILSQKQLGDPHLMSSLGEIPKSHACLLSHLGRTDLELFLKGDDVLRKSILKKDPPDQTQRRQFAYLEAKSTWKNIILQLDVSLLGWNNGFSETGSAKTLAEMRRARQQAKEANSPSVAPVPPFSPKPT